MSLLIESFHSRYLRNYRKRAPWGAIYVIVAKFLRKSLTNIEDFTPTSRCTNFVKLAIMPLKTSDISFSISYFALLQCEIKSVKVDL